MINMFNLEEYLNNTNFEQEHPDSTHAEIWISKGLESSFWKLEGFSPYAVKENDEIGVYKGIVVVIENDSLEQTIRVVEIYE